MTGYLQRLVVRASGTASPGLRPRPASRFEPAAVEPAWSEPSVTLARPTDPGPAATPATTSGAATAPQAPARMSASAVPSAPSVAPPMHATERGAPAAPAVPATHSPAATQRAVTAAARPPVAADLEVPADPRPSTPGPTTAPEPAARIGAVPAAADTTLVAATTQRSTVPGSAEPHRPPTAPVDVPAPERSRHVDQQRGPTTDTVDSADSGTPVAPSTDGQVRVTVAGPVLAAPANPPSPRAPRGSTHADASPSVTVTIGRVEVRAPAPPVPTPARRAARADLPPLADYLHGTGR